MKKIFIICSLTLLGHFSVAQSINVPNKLEINEGKEELDKVQRNGFSIELAGNEKEIIKAFEEFLEDDMSYDVKSLFKKISAENLLIPSFSEKHFNLNAQVREKGSTLVLWYWVSFGTDVFVNSEDYPDESVKCQSLLKEFGKAYYTSFIEEDLSQSTKILEKSQDELNDVTEDIIDLNKDQVKEQKKRDKLDKKRLKMQEKLDDIQQSLNENKVELEQQDAEIAEVTKMISEKSNMESELKSKISEQEKTVNELKQKLEMVKGF